MRVRRPVCTLAATALLLATSAGPALAHASFDKAQVPAETDVDLTFRAPQEQPSTNARIEALAPQQFTILDCTAPDGWTCEIDTSSEAPDTLLTWEATDDALLPEQDFPFRVHTPRNDQQGVYAWPVIQTYANGHVAEWIGETAPTIQVGDSTDPVIDNTEAPEPHEEPSTPPASDGPGGEPGAEPSPESSPSDAAPTSSEPPTARAGTTSGDASATPAGASEDDLKPGGEVEAGARADDPDAEASQTGPGEGSDDAVPVGLIVAVIALALGGAAAFMLRGRAAN